MGSTLILSPPEPLAIKHQINEFDCGKLQLNDWLIRYARQAQSSGSAKTFVIADNERVVSYFSLIEQIVDKQ